MSSQREKKSFEYVKYLSIRGEMETALVDYAFNELEEDSKFDPANDPALAAIIKGMLTDFVATWNEAGKNVIVPEDGAIHAADRTTEQLAESVKDIASVEATPKLEGKKLIMILTPGAPSKKPTTGHASGSHATTTVKGY